MIFTWRRPTTLFPIWITSTLWTYVIEVRSEDLLVTTLVSRPLSQSYVAKCWYTIAMMGAIEAPMHMLSFFSIFRQLFFFSFLLNFNPFVSQSILLSPRYLSISHINRFFIAFLVDYPCFLVYIVEFIWGVEDFYEISKV